MSAVMVSKCSTRGQSRIKRRQLSRVLPSAFLSLSCLGWSDTAHGNQGTFHMRDAGMSGAGGGGALKLAATHKGPQAERSCSVTLSWHLGVLPAFTSKAQPPALFTRNNYYQDGEPGDGRGVEGGKLLLFCSVWWGMIIGGRMFAITWAEQLLWTSVFMETNFCNRKPLLFLFFLLTF